MGLYGRVVESSTECIQWVSFGTFTQSTEKYKRWDWHRVCRIYPWTISVMVMIMFSISDSLCIQPRASGWLYSLLRISQPFAVYFVLLIRIREIYISARWCLPCVCMDELYLLYTLLLLRLMWLLELSQRFVTFVRTVLLLLLLGSNVWVCVTLWNRLYACTAHR